MKKRILLHYPKAGDSTSMWRGAGPMKLLARQMPDVEFVEFKSDESNWSDLWGFDAVFLQRPASSGQKGFLHMAKRLGVKTWVDFDDDLFNVPISNKAHEVYGNRDVQRNVTTMIVDADLVTVSTTDLQQKYGILNKNTHVVSNAWAKQHFKYRDPDRISRAKIVLWRGTETHAQDLDEFLPSMGAVARDHPEWKFVFVGGVHWKVHDYIPKEQLAVIPPMEQTTFYDFIYKLSPKVMVVPLSDHTFNHAKSNIAWIEASFCGAAAICPNWREWRQPGAINYTSTQEFEERLRTCLIPGYDTNAHSQESWNFISSFCTLDQTNIQREGLLRKLLG